MRYFPFSIITTNHSTFIYFFCNFFVIFVKKNDKMNDKMNKNDTVEKKWKKWKKMKKMTTWQPAIMAGYHENWKMKKKFNLNLNFFYQLSQ